jgi:hypothetical protein
VRKREKPYMNGELLADDINTVTYPYPGELERNEAFAGGE